MKVVIAVLAAGLLLAAGCTTDDPKPNYSSASTTPSASVSPSPSATGVPTTGPNVRPGEVPPTLDSDAAADTYEGALAFVASYVRYLDWLYATSDTSVVAPFYSADCATCASNISNIQKLLAGGNHFVGGRLHLIEIGSVQNDGRGGATLAITARLDIAAGSLQTVAGATVREFTEAPSSNLTDWLKFDGTSWRIVEERFG